jgi:hypothetical protein
VVEVVVRSTTAETLLELAETVAGVMVVFQAHRLLAEQIQEVVAEEWGAVAQRVHQAALVSLSSKSHLRTMPHSHLV